MGARDEQQDASVVLSSADGSHHLLVVGDGVGGNSGGRIASHKIVELARKLWEERGGELSDPYADLALLCKVAHDQMVEDGIKLGMIPRSTVVALYLTPTQAHWIHSGDSRLYHFREGKLLLRTEDHSLLQVMVRQGLVKEEDMGRHPDQATLLQSLGGEEYKEPDQNHADITPDDAFLLCTDGFWERTPVDEMSALLSTPRAQVTPVLQAAVQRAVQRNGRRSDNVTVAIALPQSESVHAVAPANSPAASPWPQTTSSSPRLAARIVIVAALVLCVIGSIAALLWFSSPSPTNRNIASPAPAPSSRPADSRSSTVKLPLDGERTAPEPRDE